MSSLLPDPLRTVLFLGVFPLFALMTAAPLQAGETVLSPSLSLRQEYNDNVYAETSGKRGDHISTVSPALSLSWRDETADARISSGVNAPYYLRDTKEPDPGYFLRGGGNLALSPRGALAAGLDLTRDSGASSIDPETSLPVGSRIDRQGYRIAGRYRLSERVLSVLELGWSRDDYQSPAYLDTEHYQGSARVEYGLPRLAPDLVLSPQISLRRDSTGQSRVDNLGVALGVSRRLDELWDTSLSAGWRFTRSEFSAAQGGGTTESEDTGAIASFTLGFRGETLAAKLDLSHALTSASGQNGARQRTGGSLTVSERFTRRLSGSVTAGYARSSSSQNQFASQEVDDRSGSLAASLGYRILEGPRDLSLEALYNRYNTRYRIAGTEMTQNIVMLRLNWRHDMFR